IPNPVGVRGRVAHSDFQVRLGAYFDTQPGLHTKNIGKAKSLNFRRPNLVRSAVALQLDWFESDSCQLAHRLMNPFRTHRQEPQEARVRFEAHQDSSSLGRRTRADGVVPSALARANMFSKVTFLWAPSTELT